MTTLDYKKGWLFDRIIYCICAYFFMSILLCLAKSIHFFILQAWSITYHSWLTFVLLLAACIIWMIPNSRRVILVLSPIILFYGICLLLIQFIYGMDLNKELPDESNGIKLSDVGLKKFQYPCLQLALQVNVSYNLLPNCHGSLVVKCWL